MNLLTEEVQDAIRKSLPAHLSHTLQEELKGAHLVRSKLKELEEWKETAEKKVRELQRLESEKEAIRFGLEQLSDAKQKFEIEKRDWKIQELQNKYSDVKSLMHDVFRNQRLVYRAESTKYIAGHYEGSNYVNDHSESHSQEFEKKEE